MGTEFLDHDSGTGLTLTTAANALPYDLWRNPDVETWSTDRPSDSASPQTVLVHRFTLVSFEEHINDLILVKRTLVKVSKKSSWAIGVKGN